MPGGDRVGDAGGRCRCCRRPGPGRGSAWRWSDAGRGQALRVRRCRGSVTDGRRAARTRGRGRRSAGCSPESAGHGVQDRRQVDVDAGARSWPPHCLASARSVAAAIVPCVTALGMGEKPGPLQPLDLAALLVGGDEQPDLCGACAWIARVIAAVCATLSYARAVQDHRADLVVCDVVETRRRGDVRARAVDHEQLPDPLATRHSGEHACAAILGGLVAAGRSSARRGRRDRARWRRGGHAARSGRAGSRWRGGEGERRAAAGQGQHDPDGRWSAASAASAVRPSRRSW